jgi:hypothetical protein
MDRLDHETDQQYRSRLINLPTTNLSEGQLSVLAAKITALAPRPGQIVCYACLLSVMTLFKHFLVLLDHLFLIDFCSLLLNVQGYPEPLPSPNLRAAVWILCLRLADGSYDPVGSIFAITCPAMNLLLTADHN